MRAVLLLRPLPRHYLKGCMSIMKSTLVAAWQFVLLQLRSLSIIPECEPSDFPFAESDIAQLHRLRSDPGAASLDDATWKDLMLDTYHATLSKEVSIFGQQALYQRMRAGRRGDDSIASVKGLMQDRAKLEDLHGTCKSLRHATREIATLLYEDPVPATPWWAGKTWLLTLLLAASVLGAACSPLSWIGAGIALYYLITTETMHWDRMEAWQRSMLSVQMLLRVTTLLGGADARQASKLNRSMTRMPDFFPGMHAYMDWFMLANVNHYYKSVGLVRYNLTFVRQCFERVSNLEADIALARHLLRVPFFCRASVSPGPIDLRDMYLPLLEKAQPLTIRLAGKGAFLSGQNGIGKSTLLRTVGLNLVAARAFGFCYAAQACVPDVPVYASMQSEDSLMDGESLYMAELRRAKELLASANGPHPGVCIIDEIFRGTNHMESISAAASVLNLLAARNTVFVSSHNLVLAPLLAHRLEPLCVAKGTDGLMILAPGTLAHTNGIALLSSHGFSGEVEANAARVFDWLSTYLADPVDCSGVLA